MIRGLSVSSGEYMTGELEVKDNVRTYSTYNVSALPIILSVEKKIKTAQRMRLDDMLDNQHLLSLINEVRSIPGVKLSLASKIKRLTRDTSCVISISNDITSLKCKSIW